MRAAPSFLIAFALGWAGCADQPAPDAFPTADVVRGPVPDFVLIGISGDLVGEGEGEPQFCSSGPPMAEVALDLEAKRMDARNLGQSQSVGFADLLEWTHVHFDALNFPPCMQLPIILSSRGANATMDFWRNTVTWNITREGEEVKVDGVPFAEDSSHAVRVSFHVEKVGRAGPWNFTGEIRITNHGIWQWADVQQVPSNGVVTDRPNWARLE